GTLGARADVRLLYGFSLDVIATVALGSTHQVLDVAGSTAQFTPGSAVPVATAAGGLFALPGNIGRTGHDTVSGHPVAEVKVAWSVSERVRLTLGYDFLYWTRVLRPADQIPGVINTTSAPSQATFGSGGPSAPAAGFRHSDLPVQGLSFGAE